MAGILPRMHTNDNKKWCEVKLNTEEANKRRGVWLHTKNMMDGAICEYAQKVNADDVVYIMIKTNEQGHSFKVLQIGTKRCIIYDVTPQYNTSLKLFLNKLPSSVDRRIICSGVIKNQFKKEVQKEHQNQVQ